jgi:ribose-phosphate pyrophosphokinase
MITLKNNLDKSIDFDLITFSGGEPHVKINWLDTEFDTYHILHRIQSFNDLGNLLVFIDALKRKYKDFEGCEPHIHLAIPYFPAARQDRVCDRGNAFTLKVYADIINSQNFDEVTVFDPHSDVTPALINNVRVVSNDEFVRCAMIYKQDQGPVQYVIPDAGASKKAQKNLDYLMGEKPNVIQCSKNRDTKTGKILGYNVYGEVKPLPTFVVDDICDGGATFNLIAQELRSKVPYLELIVSHGIFSKGLDTLLQNYDLVTCTTSFDNGLKHEKLRQYDIESLI